MRHILLVMFTAYSGYSVLLLDTLAFNYDASASGNPLTNPLDMAQLDRISLKRSYSITGWFAFEYPSSDVFDVVGLVDSTGAQSIWYPCVTITTDKKFNVIYNTDSFELDQVIFELDWYFISAWVNIRANTFGIWIGTPNNASNSAVATICDDRTYSQGMTGIDTSTSTSRSNYKIKIGSLDLLPAGNHKFDGYVFDLHLRDEDISDTTEIDTEIATYSCHSNCNNNCHGPTPFDCNDFIQITHPWFDYTVTGEKTFDRTTGLFSKRSDSDYGGDTNRDSTWIGWIFESEISSIGAGDQTYIFSQYTTNCSPSQCTQKAVLYENGIGHSDQNTLRVSYEDVGDGTFNTPTTKYFTSASNRIGYWNFVAASFCYDNAHSSQHVHLYKGQAGDSGSWTEATNSPTLPLWSKWPSSVNGQENHMKLGHSLGNVDATFKNVRYYHNRCLSDTELEALFDGSNLENPWTEGCNYSNSDPWLTCETGYWHARSETCERCHEAWSACNGGSDIDCYDADINNPVACAPGYVKLDNNWCTTSCPTGTTENNRVCDYDDNQNICEFQFVTFNTDNQTFADAQNSITAQLGNTSNQENSDPKVLNLRGLYFDGVDDVLIIDPTANQLTLPLTWSIYFWFKYVNTGQNNYILGRYDDMNNESFSVYVNSIGNGLDSSVTIFGKQEISLGAASPTVHSKWVLGGLSCQYTYLTKSTQCLVHSGDTTGTDAPLFDTNSGSRYVIMKDDPTNKFILGGGFDSGTPKFMHGFIYNFYVFHSSISSVLDVVKYSGSCAVDRSGGSTCDMDCPLDGFCISEWTENQYIDAHTYTCQHCGDHGHDLDGTTLLECKAPCSTALHWVSRQWDDANCELCLSNYNTGSRSFCDTCINDTFTLNNGVCECSPGNVVGSTCCTDYLQDGACVSQCSIGYGTDTVLLQCIQCPTNCDYCSSSAACTTCSAQHSLISGTCVACPSNCDSCSSSTTCTTCTSPYVLRDNSQCYTSCQDGWYENVSSVCAECHGSCATCTGAEYDKWLTWATGLSKIGSTATTVSAWDCSSTANVSKEVKIACLSDSSVTNSESSTSGTSDTANVLYDITNLIEEELSVEEYQQVIEIIGDQNLESAQQEQQAIDIMVQGGINAVANTDTKSLTITSEKFDAQFTQEYQASLPGSNHTTTTGSGVLIPIDLEAQDVVAPDANLIVNIVHMKVNDTNSELLSGQDIISVSITQLLDNGQAAEVVYQNLTTNFTIVFENQSFNTTEEFEWVFLQANEWITDGCYLNSLESSRAECACNHLTQFSMRKGAEADNNAAATTDFSSAANYSLDTNQTPLILIIVILAIWFPIFFLLRRADLKLELHPEEQTEVKIRNAFARAFGMFSQTQNESFDAQSSPDSPNGVPEFLKAVENHLDAKTQNQVTTVRPDVKENAFETVTFRNETKNENAGRMTLTIEQPKKDEDDPNKDVVPEISFKRRFFQTFKIIGVFINGGEKILRSELWAIFLCIVMVSIFVTGLFYQDDSADDEDESEKSFTETLEAFGWEDFWIIFYSVCITLPIPLILRWFFLRKKIDSTKEVGKQIRTRRIKRTIGYILVFLIVAWCAWSCIAFSLAFGYNATQRWMTAYGISEAFDLTFKDPFVALSIVLAGVMVGYIRDRLSQKLWIGIHIQTKEDQGTSKVFPLDKSIDASMNSSYAATVQAQEQPKLQGSIDEDFIIIKEQ